MLGQKSQKKGQNLEKWGELGHEWGTLGQGYRWTDLEKLHIFVCRLIKKGAKGKAGMSIFGFFRSAEASP